MLHPFSRADAGARVHMWMCPYGAGLRQRLGGCAGALTRGGTGRARGLGTHGRPERRFTFPVPHRELLFGLERQGHETVGIRHEHDPERTWKNGKDTAANL